MDIVGLLNDLSSSGNLMDEVFMGDDGQPTDRFLEALKFNGSRGSHTTRENVHSNSAFGSRDYASGNQKTAAAVGSAKDLEPEYVPHTQVHKTSHHGATRRASNCIQKEKDNDKSKGKGSGKGQSKDINKYKDNNKEIDKSDEKPLVVHQKPFYGTPRPSKAALVRAKDGSARAAVAEAKSQLNNSGQELAFSARQRPKKIFRSQNLTARRQALAATLLSGGASPHIPGSSLNRSSSRSRIEEKDSDEDVEMTRSEQEGEESAAAEGRARTLQLRLSGQQQALRAVEVQLVEALTLLEERSRQLAHAEGRCKAMRHELDIAQKKAQLRTLETARAVEAHRGDLLEESRARIEHLEAQLAEEVARRRRADDRGRLLKEYGERTKARGLEVSAYFSDLSVATCARAILPFCIC